VLSRKDLPASYQEWNQRWGAPYGHAAIEVMRATGSDTPPAHLVKRALQNPADQSFGPFAFQYASGTRVFEYPWAYHAADIQPGQRVLDIGGGLSGLQFVLDLCGCQVVNVDPSARPDYNRWTGENYINITPKRHQELNEALGTSVTLVGDFLQDAKLEPESFDRAFCLSTLEHCSPEEAAQMLRSAEDCLRPGGLLVLTVDLFLDLEPFGVLTQNRWGVNHDLSALIGQTGLELTAGRPDELLGFPEFDRARVVAALPELLVSWSYPVISQTLVLRRPLA
jgi:SAM-dependent methyltransferase